MQYYVFSETEESQDLISSGMYHVLLSTFFQSLHTARNLKPQQILLIHFRNYAINPQNNLPT